MAWGNGLPSHSMERKGRWTGDDKLPVDPVARFHLGNGAAIHAVHADADISENGMAQSGGAMVNYLYEMSQVTTNHEQFVTDKTVAASKEVRSLRASVS